MNKDYLIIENEKINIDSLYVGKYIFLNDEISEILDGLFYSLNKNHQKIESGLYSVKSIEKKFQDKSKLNWYDSAYEIVIANEYWIPDIYNNVYSLSIVINYNGDVVFSGQMIIENCIKDVIFDIEDLKKINDSRFDCICCKNPLNIISMNLRFCSKCESNFDEILEGIDTEDEITDFDGKENETTLDLFPLLPILP